MEGNTFNLTYRLGKIASYVEKGDVVADIGSDHGYIPIFLAVNQISPKVYAADVNKGPLEKAKVNISRLNVEDKVIPLLSDGLTNLEDPLVDTLIIAGMGGHLVKRILEDGKGKLTHVNKLILSPHNDVDVVRRVVHQLGYSILEEDFICDENKYYNIMICIKADESYINDIDYIYGRKLIETKNPIFKKFLTEKHNKYKDIVLNLEKEKSLVATEKRAQLLEYLIELDGVIKCL